MFITNFKDVIAWQKAGTLNTLLYNKFKNTRDFTFKDQRLRAAISIMNNIAEGFERGTKPELRRFLYIVKGSNAEVKSMLYLAKKINYITDEEFIEYKGLTIEISKMLASFIKALK